MTEQSPGEPGSGQSGDSGEPGGPSQLGRAAEFGPGAQIAGYRLEERIGQGGMAVVYRAYDSRLDRHVALKILAPGLAADEAFQRRFIRESRAAAAVDDPHIIPVFEAGESNGVLFIAMRYVRGGDVRRLIDTTGQLPPDQAAEIVSQAASALDAAHARGLVHRDVKPANMLLEASSGIDRPGHVYLSDFGLSKTALAVSGLTATGQFLGTLDYVAPEQIEGRVLDGRSDLYSLACSAFEMLCGEPPFRREQGVSVMYAHLSEVPPPLRLRRPELPAEIDAVMARALAKAPADRYASCREFAAAFRSALGLDIARPRPGQRPAHPVTEIAMPSAGAGSPGPGDASQPAAADAYRAPTGPSRSPAGPPLTQPAGIVKPTQPGLTDPSSGADAQHPVRSGDGSTRGEADRPGGGEPPDGGGLAGGYRQPAGEGGRTGPARRPWWRSPAPVAAALAVVLIAGAGTYLATRGGHNSAGSGPGNVHVTQLKLPGCTTRTANARTLTVASATTPAGANPFGVAVSPKGQYTFVSGSGSVSVLRNGAALAPSVVRTFPVPGADKGDAITRDGNFLLAASGSGAAVINVSQAVQGATNPVVGMLTSPSGAGAVEVLITTNEKYAFVTLQSSAEMAVFNLHSALTQGVTPSDFIGYVPLPKQPVGMATDGTWMYVASIQGTVTVLSMKKAETDPLHAVVAHAPAGCGAARALLSPDHKVLWVTDRQGDAVVAFSAPKLRSDPTHALLARVMIGETPVGEALFRHGSRLVVADGNLNNLKGVRSNMAVINTAVALSGKPALLGYVPTGLVPRQFAIEPGGKTLLVTLQKSGELQAFAIADLP